MPQSDDSPIKLHHFLTGRDDATIFGVSVLSRPAEWHALAVGVLAGLHPAAAGAVATYVLGRQFGKASRPDDAPLSGHVRDAAREPAYWVAGVVLTRVALTAATGAPLVPPDLVAAVGG